MSIREIAFLTLHNIYYQKYGKGKSPGEMGNRACCFIPMLSSPLILLMHFRY